MQNRLPGSAGKKKALTTAWDLTRELALDEVSETAEGFEYLRVDLVVIESDAKVLFQRRDDIYDRHRVELRHST